jgi:hypothetical protein
LTIGANFTSFAGIAAVAAVVAVIVGIHAEVGAFCESDLT